MSFYRVHRDSEWIINSICSFMNCFTHRHHVGSCPLCRIQTAAETIKSSSSPLQSVCLSSPLHSHLIYIYYILYFSSSSTCCSEPVGPFICQIPLHRILKKDISSQRLGVKRQDTAFRNKTAACFEGVSRKQSVAGGAGAALLLSGNPAQHPGSV